MLIENGSDPNLANSNGNVPLHEVSILHDVDLLKMLLEAKADVNVQDATDLLSSLHFAAGEGLEENARELIDNGALTTSQSLTSLTPLHISSIHQNTTGLVTLLLGAGKSLYTMDQRAYIHK